MKIQAYQSDGKGGARVVMIEEPEEIRIHRERAEALAALDVEGLLRRLDELEARVAALEERRGA